nr:MAG TPA_asm: hypothetical protein [Caudoviricetes sp.]
MVPFLYGKPRKVRKAPCRVSRGPSSFLRPFQGRYQQQLQPLQVHPLHCLSDFLHNLLPVIHSFCPPV